MIVDSDALNYPYIHVRDVDWLKRTLILFPHVVRMTPFDGAPFDSEEIMEFVRVESTRGPLLRSARLFDPPIEEAQRELRDRLTRDIDADDRFLTRFSRERTLRTPNKSFQIHQTKLAYSLMEFLQQTGLAWTPSDPHGPRYLETHPKLGGAVMATLAYACAKNEGLEVVTEFPDLHGQISGRATDTAIYDAIIHGERMSRASDVDALQILFHLRCDVRKVTPRALVELHKNYEPLADLKSMVKEISARVPQIESDHLRQEYLNDVVDVVLQRWARDKANLPNFLRQLFGGNSISEPVELFEKLADKVTPPALAGAIVGNFKDTAVVGAAAGLAIGFVSYAAASWLTVSRREQNSPFRYLTLAEKGGASFAVGA